MLLLLVILQADIMGERTVAEVTAVRFLTGVLPAMSKHVMELGEATPTIRAHVRLYFTMDQFMFLQPMGREEFLTTYLTVKVPDSCVAAHVRVQAALEAVGFATDFTDVLEDLSHSLSLVNSDMSPESLFSKHLATFLAKTTFCMHSKMEVLLTGSKANVVITLRTVNKCDGPPVYFLPLLRRFCFLSLLFFPSLIFIPLLFFITFLLIGLIFSLFAAII